LNDTNWGSVLYRDKDAKGTNEHWAFPLITGHKYKVSWATTGLDFEEIHFTLSEKA
jgi:hypothetical protein